MSEPRGCPTPGACSCPSAPDELEQAIVRINALMDLAANGLGPGQFKPGILYGLARAVIELRKLIAERPAAAVGGDAALERAAVTLQGLVPSISLSYARDTAAAILAESVQGEAHSARDDVTERVARVVHHVAPYLHSTRCREIAIAAIDAIPGAATPIDEQRIVDAVCEIPIEGDTSRLDRSDALAIVRVVRIFQGDRP